MNMLVSAAALLLACTGFFIYDQITFRESLVRTLSAQAQIIASNSVSALIFNDPQAAANTLSALRRSTNIASAGILTPDNRPFAQYERGPEDQIVNIRPLRGEGVEGHWFGAAHVVLMRKILSEGKLVGYVYLRADLHEIHQRLRRYALIAVSVLLMSLLLALAVSSAFGKTVARPIVALASAARQVSGNRDYGVRMPRSTDNDELAVLIDSFNEMLNEIQQRDRALRAAHDELEQRVTDRTRELMAANRELEAFSYSVSHDLRGPLDSLNGFIYVLLQRYGQALGADGQDLVQQIRASSRRMLQLIDDLLNLSRVSSSTMHSEAVDLRALAFSIAEELRRSNPERRVEFVISNVPQAHGDAHLLHIVLENLLRNAWKYTSQHATACIEFGSLSRDGHSIYFVRDDGAGFDPASIKRLFQPFQRLHSSAEFPGTGIGLATVARIVHRHGGEIWAEGGIERGATFYFTLSPETVHVP